MPTEITALPTPPSRQDPDNFAARGDAFMGALPDFVAEANALATELNGLVTNFGYAATSVTSNTVDASGPKTFTVQTELSYQAGQFILIASTASPENYIVGQISSYNAETGELVVSADKAAGSGTFADWSLSLTLSAADEAFIATEADRAEAGADLAESYANVAAASGEIYASTADALSNGLKTVAITGAGTGGTDAQYIIPVTGTTGDNGKLMAVVSGGELTELSILGSGKSYTGPIVADIDTPTGLTGATASITIGPNRDVGDSFIVSSAGAYSPRFYRVDTGPVATEINASYATGYVDSVNARLAEVLSGSADVWSLIALSVIDDYFVHKDTGVVTSNVNFKYVEITLLGVESGVRVTSALSGASTCLAAYYDKAGAFISSEQSPGVETSYDDFELTIPATARLIRLTGTEAAAISVQQLTVGDIAGRLGSLEESTSSIQSVYDTLSEWAGQSYTYTDGGYLNYLTGDVTVNANFRYAFVTLATEAQSVRVSGWVESTLSALAIFYDESDNYLGYQERGSGVAIEQTDIVLTLPDGTAKIGISSRIAQSPHIVEERLVAEGILSRLDVLESGVSGAITVWGDSTSYAGTTGIGDEIAALFPSHAVYQQGIGGQQWLDKIRYRTGHVKTTVTVSGGVIPSSGAAVEVTLANSILYHATKNFTAQVMIAGVRCALRWDFASAQNTISALDDIADNVAVSAGTTVYVLTGVVEGVAADPADCTPIADLLKGIQIVRSVPSINDRFNIDYDAMAQEIEDVIEYLTRYSDKVLLVGMLNGNKDLPDTYSGGQWATQAESYAVLAYVRWANDYMRNHAPLFVDPMQNHIDNDGSVVLTINGVDFDVLANTAVVPKLADDRHETEDAQDSTAQLIADAIEATGWA